MGADDTVLPPMMGLGPVAAPAAVGTVQLLPIVM
jgi:hypothetical protein